MLLYYIIVLLTVKRSMWQLCLNFKMITVRTQRFHEKFRKQFFYIFLFFLNRYFQGIFSYFKILIGAAYI